MKVEEFWRLQEGDELRYNGAHFLVHTVAETVYEPTVGHRVTYTVQNARGQTLKAIDPWLDAVEVVEMGDPIPPVYLRRLEYVVMGIEETSRAWQRIEMEIEHIVETYGGEIVEID